MSLANRSNVLSKYRELLRLVSRLPADKRDQAFSEARGTLRARRTESNPEKQLQHLKELSSRIGYLRIITPKQPGEVTAGVYVVRDGKVMEGSGESKGARVADGTISMDDAMRRNERDFKRFYGAAKPKNILF